MDVVRRDSDGVILQRGSGLAVPEGATLVTLTEEEDAAFLALLAQPNGGIVLDLPAPEDPPATERTFTALPDVAGEVAAAVERVQAAQQPAEYQAMRRKVLGQLSAAFANNPAQQAAILALAAHVLP